MRTVRHRRIGVEEGLKVGLRNFWYPLYQAEKLGEQPVGIKRLGEDLVLWRDGEGKAHCFADLCPHRGAKLSLGRVIEGQLTCWYHSFQFDSDGKCTYVATEGEGSKLARRLNVRHYPTEEKAGLIWAYIGDVELFPPPPLVIPREMEAPDWTGFIFEAEWQASWLLVLDNLADVMHAPHLHGKSYTLSRGIRHDVLQVVDLEDGFMVERQKQKGVNFDWTEFHNTGVLWCRLDIPYPWSAGPGGPMRILGFVSPIDENNCVVFFVRMRHVDGWKRTLWRNLYKIRLERLSFNVVEQDRLILESQRGLQSRLAEHLAQSDVGVIRLRKLLNQEYARQQAIYNKAMEDSANASEEPAETEQAEAETAAV
jgi:phenylpropionate dioxygenase-like ring-hydroxylating dioxygenase large terminal subunit